MKKEQRPDGVFLDPQGLAQFENTQFRNNLKTLLKKVQVQHQVLVQIFL